MKRYIDTNFDIFYNDCDEEYINYLIQELNVALIEYIKFFNLQSISSKIKIFFYDNIENFKSYYEKTRNHEYKKGVVGSALDNEIHILSLKERIKERPNDTLQTLIMGIKHELVHICHIFYKGTNTGTWFAEGLAINLGSPRYEETLEGCTVELLLSKKAKYKHYYTLVKYMLSNYSKEKILEYAKNDDLVIQDTEEIYKETINYLDSKRKNL